jgi:predicted transcriptional regulator
LHISQNQLARETGIPQADNSRIERDKGNPAQADVTRLLDALKFGATGKRRLRSAATGKRPAASSSPQRPDQDARLLSSRRPPPGRHPDAVP